MHAEPFQDLRIEYGGYRGILNPQLVRQQQLGASAIESLRESHVEKLQLFERMRDARTPDELLALAREIDGLEYRQQSLWGFALDPKFHGWFEVPRCTCCKTWNAALQGDSQVRLICAACPVHSQLVRSGTPRSDGLEGMDLSPSIGRAAVRIRITDGFVALPASGTYWAIDTRDPVHGTPLLYFVRPEPLSQMN